MKNENKFCCYGTYSPRNERCLIKCPFNFECKLEKYQEEIIENKQEDENEKNIKG